MKEDQDQAVLLSIKTRIAKVFSVFVLDSFTSASVLSVLLIMNNSLKDLEKSLNNCIIIKSIQ
jgi:hypothetical protein